jgi:hypothetical protein
MYPSGHSKGEQINTTYFRRWMDPLDEVINKKIDDVFRVFN